MKCWLAVAVLLVAPALAAQEFGVFDLNDFVDPRLHGAVYDESGEKLVEPGEPYRIIRVASGGIANYAWRARPGSDEVLFLHVVGSEYQGATQKNVKLTVQQSKQESVLPGYHLTAQLAHYRMEPPTRSQRRRGMTEGLAERWLVGVSIEENRYANAEGDRRPLNAELSAELDLVLPLLKGKTVEGSFVFVSRNTQAEQWTHRASYFYRLPLWTRGPVRVAPAVGVGVERTDSWHWGGVRLGLRTSMDVGSVGTLNAVWTPGYLPGSRRFYHELAFFVDRTVFQRWAGLQGG